MKQCVRFHNRVYKDDGTNRVVEVGDTVSVRLEDGTYEDIEVTAVEDDGYTICFDHATETLRQGDIRGVSADHIKDCTDYGGATTPGTPDPIGWE